jgi:CRISPR-associated protein Csx17
VTVHCLAGIRPTPLASYLAGLGLARVLGEQADPALRAWWAGDSLTIDTSIADLAGWLAEAYMPTPVLSPWNEGSGFGIKDVTPKQTLATLLSTMDARLDGYREAAKAAATVGDEYRKRGLTKEQAVRAFRNTCPDPVVAWIDATVVLADGTANFPPLLGSGGNDGRLDFSTNVHQRLLDVFHPKTREHARRQALDLLTGEQVEPLRVAAVGQYDPVAAGGPRSSPFGTADSLVNPWAFILMIEGALWFAAGVARRHAHAAGRAAMPFTVLSSPDGAPGGAAGEATRGEVWAPLWTRPFTVAEIGHLFGEARAAWDGRPAVRAVEFYQAVVTRGVARGVDSFQRYGLHQRNGLAYVAVPLDRVAVRPLPAVRLAARLEAWVTRVPRTAPAAARAAARRFEAAQIGFAKTGSAAALIGLLAALTDLELAVGRSGRLRADVGVRRPPAAVEFLPVLADIESPELRIACGLASCATIATDPRSRRSLRSLILPIDPGPHGRPDLWRDAPMVPGYGIRPLRDLLTDVLAWRCRTAADEPAVAFRGVPTFRAGLCVPATDLHAWASGQLDDAAFERYLHAMVALDWTAVHHRWTGPQPGTASVVPVPTLALLHTLADGITSNGDGNGELRLALDPGWAVLLRAGHVGRVHNQAARRLRQAGWRTSPAPPAATLHDGRALAAAALPRCSGTVRMLRRIAVKALPTDTPPWEEPDV